MSVGFARTAKWRAGLAAVAAMAIVGGLLTGGPTSASAATGGTTAWYVLVNRTSGKALDVYNFSTADGANVVQWTRTNAPNQQFQFVDSGSGYYRIKARHSGKVIDVSSWSTADGAAIHQWMPTVPPSTSGPTATPPTSSSGWPTPTAATCA